MILLLLFGYMAEDFLIGERDEKVGRADCSKFLGMSTIDNLFMHFLLLPWSGFSAHIYHYCSLEVNGIIFICPLLTENMTG